MKRRTLTLAAAAVAASAGAVAVMTGATGASGAGGGPNQPGRQAPPPAELLAPKGTPPPSPPRAPGPDDVVVVNVVRGGRTYPLRLHPQRRVTVDAQGNRNEEVVLDPDEAERQLRSLGVPVD